MKALKLEVNPKYKAHQRRSEISYGHSGSSVYGCSIRKNIDDQSQKETKEQEGGPVFFNGVPEQEHNIDHRIDEAVKIQFVKYEHLHQDEQHKPQCDVNIIPGHRLAHVQVQVSPRGSGR